MRFCYELWKNTFTPMATQRPTSWREQPMPRRIRISMNIASVCCSRLSYYELLRRQYIQPKPDPHSLDLNNFVLTTMGQQWLSNHEPLPEDRDGYVRALTEYVPNIDPIVLQYVREALVTFDRDALFASAVMIGAASEKTLYMLLDGLHVAVQDAVEKKKIEKAISERSLPKMYRVIDENLARAKRTGMPYTVHEEADRHLLSLQDSIRVQRNHAVHPQIGQVTRESLRLSLTAFPFACKKVYDLIGWLKANAI